MTTTARPSPWIADRVPRPAARVRLVWTYRHRPGPLLGCPITAFGGIDDGDVPRARLEPWAEVTRGPFRLRMLPGGHFFLHEAEGRAELLAEIARILHDA